MSVETMKSQEAIPTIELSPERVAEVLDLEADEVRTQLSSLQGREKLLRDLTSDPERLRSVIDPESLRAFEADMKMTEEDLHAQERFLQAQKDPEKKGMFRRAWDAITGFPRKHPIITVALLGVVLGVVASYMGWLPAINFSGLWGRAQGWLGWGSGAAEGAAGEAAGEAVVGAEAVMPGVEAPLGTLESLIPETYRIRITEHSFLYDNKLYGMEELPELIKKLPEISPDMPLKIARYPDARPTAEIALQQLLEATGVKEGSVQWLPGMIEKEFIPLDKLPSGQ